MDKKLIRFSVMPTQVKTEKQISEICNDIQAQYENNVSDLAIFSMSIHPDANPLKDKVTKYVADYLKVKQELDKRGLKSGILIQSTIGHGARKAEFPFQEYIKFTDGKGDGICCPLDKGFQKYIYDCVVKIASSKPSAILIDDDFRLRTRGGKGCACPLHLKKFNKENGLSLTREELFSIVTSDHEKCEEYTKKFLKVQNDSLEETAKIIRKAIDSVDPSIQGVFCNGGDDAVNITKILAGKNNPSIMRIGNGYYSYNSTSGFTYSMLRAALQRAEFSEVDYLLAETDNCPQVRYSKTAKQLHAHYVGSLLEGLNGAKHWLTRLSYANNIEWETGKAYRKILTKNAGLYQTVANLVDGISWHGFKMPVPNVKTVSFKKAVYSDINSFAEKCFERLGLPIYFSNNEGGITCFVDNNDRYFSDEQLKKELSNKAILSGEIAKKINERGFENYLGVKVYEYDGEVKPFGDLILVNGNAVATPVNYKKLVKLNNNVKTTSKLVYNDFENGLIDLTPGTTEYVNEFGGKVAVFAGTPNCEPNFFQGYSFLNESRKAQFIEILKTFNEPVIYYAGGESVYLKTGTLKDGKNFTSIINLCYDEIENFELVYPCKPNKVSYIDGGGEIKELSFSYENGTIKTNKTLYCLDTLLLIIE